jgi:hypothetical protein
MKQNAQKYIKRMERRQRKFSKSDTKKEGKHERKRVIKAYRSKKHNYFKDGRKAKQRTQN